MGLFSSDEYHVFGISEYTMKELLAEILKRIEKYDEDDYVDYCKKLNMHQETIEKLCLKIRYVKSEMEDEIEFLDLKDEDLFTLQRILSDMKKAEAEATKLVGMVRKVFPKNVKIVKRTVKADDRGE